MIIWLGFHDGTWDDFVPYSLRIWELSLLETIYILTRV